MDGISLSCVCSLAGTPDHNQKKRENAPQISVPLSYITQFDLLIFCIYFSHFVVCFPFRSECSWPNRLSCSSSRLSTFSTTRLKRAAPTNRVLLPLFIKLYFTKEIDLSLGTGKCLNYTVNWVTSHFSFIVFYSIRPSLPSLFIS